MQIKTTLDSRLTKQWAQSCFKQRLLGWISQAQTLMRSHQEMAPKATRGLAHTSTQTTLELQRTRRSNSSQLFAERPKRRLGSIEIDQMRNHRMNLI